MEELLTIEEIDLINKESKKRKYKDPFLISVPFQKTEIHKVSKKAGLILIKGNSDTGFIHIINRHLKIKRNPFWKEDPIKKKFSIDNPSKFNINTGSVDSIMELAENVFLSCEKNLTKNIKPDDFDLYIGFSNTENGNNETYRLITYKNTKIIHTLFPESRKENYKKSFNFLRGFCSTSYDFANGKGIVSLPYYDKSKRVVFHLIVYTFEIRKNEIWTIEICDSNEKPIYSYILKYTNYDINYDTIQEIIDYLNFDEINALEKEIKKLIISEKPINLLQYI